MLLKKRKLQEPCLLLLFLTMQWKCIRACSEGQVLACLGSNKIIINKKISTALFGLHLSNLHRLIEILDFPKNIYSCEIAYSIIFHSHPDVIYYPTNNCQLRNYHDTSMVGQEWAMALE